MCAVQVVAALTLCGRGTARWAIRAQWARVSGHVALAGIRINIRRVAIVASVAKTGRVAQMVTSAVVSRVAGNRCAGAHWTVGSRQAMAAVAAAVGRTVVLGAARAVEATYMRQATRDMYVHVAIEYGAACNIKHQ